MTFKPPRLLIESFEVPIFIISLDGDVSRRSDLRRFLSDDIVDTYFPASDMRNTSRAELDRLCDNQSLRQNPTYARKLRAGEIGCSLSHRRIYQYMVENSLPYAIIFEDDILPSPKWRSIVRDAVTMIDFFEADRAILVHLGLPYFKSVGRRRVVFWKNRSFSIWPEIRLVESAEKNQFWLGHSYIITHEAAKRILDQSEFLFCMCDDWREFYDRSCFDAVFVTECVFQQNFKHDSNLRNKHPLGLFDAHSDKHSDTLIGIFKGLARKSLDSLHFFNPTRWVVVNSRALFGSNCFHGKSDLNHEIR